MTLIFDLKTGALYCTRGWQFWCFWDFPFSTYGPTTVGPRHLATSTFEVKALNCDTGLRTPSVYQV